MSPNPKQRSYSPRQEARHSSAPPLFCLWATGHKGEQVKARHQPSPPHTLPANKPAASSAEPWPTACAAPSIERCTKAGLRTTGPVPPLEEAAAEAALAASSNRSSKHPQSLFMTREVFASAPSACPSVKYNQRFSNQKKKPSQ